MDTYNGSSYIIFVDTFTPITASKGTIANYRPLLCGISNGLNIEFESIAFRNKCDGGWDKTVSGYGSWGFDLDGHAIGLKNSEKLISANFQEVAQLAIKKKIFWAKMSDLNNEIVREGVVRIGSYREQADVEEPYSFTLNFVGIGEPIFTAVPLPPTPGKQLGYFGWKDDNSILTYSEITDGFQIEFDNLQNEIVIPYQVSDFKYLWFAIPNGEPVKNYYQDVADIGNQAPIGGASDLYGAPTLVVGAIDMDFYITNYKTYYNSPEPISGLIFKTV